MKPKNLMFMLVCVAVLTGCISQQRIVNSAVFQNKLKSISAGHTGCMPDDIQISVKSFDTTGDGTWTATCGGKTYLCTATGTNSGDTYACAPQQVP